jgi:hypothetical protein
VSTTPPNKSAAPLTLEEQLSILNQCGLKLSAPFDVDELLTSWPREEYEASNFDLVLVGVGMTEERPPWRNHCVNAWHFDTECIEGGGGYARIAKRMSEMAQGSLPLENISDFVDIDRKIAWLKFNFQGQEIRIDCQLEDDWADPLIFGHFVDLLARSDPSKIFIYYSSGGQDCVIACVTKDQLAELNRQGVPFEPLQ